MISQCSTTCGGGVQIRHVKCVNMTSQEPATGCSLDLKPNHRQPCNMDPCPDSKAGTSAFTFLFLSLLKKVFKYACTRIKLA